MPAAAPPAAPAAIPAATPAAAARPAPRAPARARAAAAAAATRPPAAAWPPAQGREELWLLGLPPLSRLLDFVDDNVVEAHTARPGSRAALAAAWRAANDRYIALEKTEAGIANQGSHRPLDAALAPLADAVAAHPHFQRAFDTLPTRFAMVELDKLIIDQRHVTRHFVEARMARIGAAATPQDVFEVCMPLHTPEAPVQVRRVGSHRFVFSSPSTDFRFLEPVLLQPGQTGNYQPQGPVAGVVGLVVGHGSNFLNAVQVGKRVLLCNGYHRAVALRALGHTHAPCIVQSASRVDELQISVKSRVADDAGFYFESARPPLLRDFFDPKLICMLPVRQRIRQIEVSFEIRDHLVAL